MSADETQQLRVDFSQQLLELQNQDIEDLNIQQKVPHVLAINISENPLQSFGFLTQFPSSQVLHADCCNSQNAIEDVFRFCPDTL